MYHQFIILKLYEIPKYFYVFYICLTDNIDFCHLQHKVIAFSKIVLTPYKPVVTICTTSYKVNSCTLCPRCIYVFCNILRIYSDLCHLLHKQTGLVT